MHAEPLATGCLVERRFYACVLLPTDALLHSGTKYLSPNALYLNFLSLCSFNFGPVLSCYVFFVLIKRFIHFNIKLFDRNTHTYRYIYSRP